MVQWTTISNQMQALENMVPSSSHITTNCKSPASQCQWLDLPQSGHRSATQSMCQGGKHDEGMKNTVHEGKCSQTWRHGLPWGLHPWSSQLIFQMISGCQRQGGIQSVSSEIQISNCWPYAQCKQHCPVATWHFQLDEWTMTKQVSCNDGELTHLQRFVVTCRHKPTVVHPLTELLPWVKPKDPHLDLWSHLRNQDTTQVAFLMHKIQGDTAQHIRSMQATGNSLERTAFVQMICKWQARLRRLQCDLTLCCMEHRRRKQSCQHTSERCLSPWLGLSFTYGRRSQQCGPQQFQKNKK